MSTRHLSAEHARAGGTVVIGGLAAPREIDFRAIFGGRPRVVIGHPLLERGGSEACVMWLAQALRTDCEVTILTTGGWDLADLNLHYGTSLAPGEVSVRLVPMPPLPRGTMAAALRAAFLQRHARRVAPEYDLRISGYNTTDWGLPAIHYLADFGSHRELRAAHQPDAPGFAYRDTPLRRGYLRLARACASPSGRDVFMDDCVMANSQWSARRMRQYCPGGRFPVVYPPAGVGFPPVAWEDKRNAFVMIGRIAPEKRIEAAIRVLGALRGRGHAPRLHLCGGVPDDAYGRQIAALAASHRDWVVLEGQVSGARKAELLASCRYGIHMRAGEPFGICVAEMIQAGAVVFAPGEGGQAEILQAPDLLFGDEAEASAKIEAVLESGPLQARLRCHLAGRGRLFTALEFMREARACIAGAVASTSHS